MRNLILAIQFLTRLPTPPLRDFKPSELAKSAAWFPVVGALAGAFVSALAFLGNQLNSELGALLALLVWVWITGALHLDGLADLTDALGAAHRDPQRFMAVMRDPHLGSFGVVALVTALLSKLVLLHVNLNHGTLSIWTLPLICAWARSGAIAWSAYLPALPNSSTERFNWDINKSVLLWNITLLLLLSAVLSPALMLAPIVLLLWGWFLKRRVGGVSGDCLGAGVEVTEVSLLLIALLPTFLASLTINWGLLM